MHVFVAIVLVLFSCGCLQTSVLVITQRVFLTVTLCIFDRFVLLLVALLSLRCLSACVCSYGLGMVFLRGL